MPIGPESGTHRDLPISHCLRCGYEVDSASTPEGAAVSLTPGSLSVCLRCGAVAKFGEDLTIVPMTEQEVDALRADRDTMAYLERIVRMIHVVQERHSRRN